MLSASGMQTADGLFNYHFGKSGLDEKGQKGSNWLGKGAEKLGLEGEVTPENFRCVLKGKSPDGETLRQEARTGKTRAGIDLTFSSPKSVSIMAVTDKDIHDAHNKAINSVFGYIEKNIASARISMNYQKSTVKTENLVAARFNHMTSRHDDPNLHSHVVVMNLTETERGYRVISERPILRAIKVTGENYRNELSQNLKNVGYQINITDSTQCFFEIKGVPEELIKKFSSRRFEILETEKEVASKGYKGKTNKIAVLSSRPDKSGKNFEELEKVWLKEISKYKLHNLKNNKPDKEFLKFEKPIPEQIITSGEKDDSVEYSITNSEYQDIEKTGYEIKQDETEKEDQSKYIYVNPETGEKLISYQELKKQFESGLYDKPLDDFEDEIYNDYFKSERIPSEQIIPSIEKNTLTADTDKSEKNLNDDTIPNKDNIKNSEPDINEDGIYKLNKKDDEKDKNTKFSFDYDQDEKSGIRQEELDNELDNFDTNNDHEKDLDDDFEIEM